MHRRYRAASPITSAMIQVLSAFPPQWRQTVTFDNGTEFARPHQFHALGIETFFCDTHTPAEILSNQVLNLKCESTFPLPGESRGVAAANVAL